MKVWIVNPFDNLPLEGYRPQRYWLMARACARAGHDVTFWTSDFSHAHKKPRRFERIVPRTADGGWQGDGFAVRLVPTPSYPVNLCLKRVWSHIRFAARWRQMAEACARPDVVIASLPPLSLGGQARRFCRAVGASFVVDVMDAWPETFARVLPPPVLAPLKAMARGIYRSANVVTAVAARYVDLACAYGVTAPVRVFHHGIALDGLPPPGTTSPSGTLRRLVYIGNMGASYDLETVIAAVRAERDVTLDLAGSGPKEPALRALAEGCPRIRFHGYLDAAKASALLTAAEVGVVPMFPDSCVGVPYKLADYAAAGLRVVNSLPGETADLLTKYGAGTFYEAGNVVSFQEALKAVSTGERFDPDGLRRVFEADRLYGEYVDFIERKVAEK